MFLVSSIQNESNGEHFLEAEGGFPLSSNFFACECMHLKCTCLNNIEAMYGRWHL